MTSVVIRNADGVIMQFGSAVGNLPACHIEEWDDNKLNNELKKRQVQVQITPFSEQFAVTDFQSNWDSTLNDLNLIITNGATLTATQVRDAVVAEAKAVRRIAWLLHQILNQ